jgi:hypothetical protein
MPVIVAPAAAVGSGSCQTSSRRRVISGWDSAKASAASTAALLGYALGAQRPALRG